jgi:hypothetical protein
MIPTAESIASLVARPDDIPARMNSFGLVFRRVLLPACPQYNFNCQSGRTATFFFQFSQAFMI